MTHLTLKACLPVQEMLPKFRRILAGYSINIVECWENEQGGTIELVTDAEGYPNIRAVSAVAYDCFGGAVMNFKFSGKHKVVNKEIKEQSSNQ